MAKRNSVLTINKSNIFASFAPALFVFFWSTGFIGAKFGLPYAEPFTFLFIRFAIASILLFCLSLWVGASWPKKPIEVFHITVSGLLLHSAYLGGVFTAINLGMSAGVTALIVGLQPIVTGVFAQILLKEKVVLRQWLGLLLGFVGVALVVSEKIFLTGITEPKITIAAIGAAIVALLGTTFGTIYQKRYCSNMHLTSGTTIQYVSTCIVMLFGAISWETMKVQWTFEFLFAILWLVLVLSLGAILLLMYLIRHNATSRLSSLFYLVPPATAVEAFFLFNERLGNISLLGMLIVIAGVSMVIHKT